LELNGMFTVNRLAAVQPVKLIVTFADADPPDAMLPTASGNVAGLVITGVQAGPAVRVSVKPASCAALAGPGPLLDNVMDQTRAAYDPDLVEIRAARVGVRPMMAVTVCGPDIVTVVEALVLLATGPLQDTKTYPVVGRALRLTTVPAAYHPPEAGVTVPLPAGETAVVSWYWVVKFAV
jgi:hypothetical protein